ncbi:MAG: tetratricopeptide repeat protein [Ignavibacteria bacterium]|nr:tetratricopeptide repeat protein [Ignavibacteria bacterium]
MKKYIRFVVLGMLFYAIHSYAQVTLENGIQLFQTKQYAKAKPVFEQLQKQHSTNAEVLYYLGMIRYVHERHIDDAIDYFEEAIELDEKNATYHYWLGSAYGSKASKSNVFKQMYLAPKIKSEFERAVELDPKYIEARQGLAQYYLLAPGIAGGSVEKAKSQADAIVKLQPYRGYISYATIYAYEKDFSRAEEYYKKAIAVDTKKGAGYNVLGYFYLRQKRIDDAIAQFKKYVEVEPDTANSYDSLGDGLLEKGMIDDAIANYRNAIALDSVFSSSIFNLAKCYEKKGMKNDAKKMYERYLSLEASGTRADEAKEKLKK